MKKIKKYTTPVFKEVAIGKYGDRFDYSKVTDVTCNKSKITVICNLCLTEKNTTIISHLRDKAHICAVCDNINDNKVQYTYEYIIKASKLMYGDIYNYDLISPTDVITSKSKLSFICSENGHFHDRNIYAHLNHYMECRECNGLKFITRSINNYTTPIFLERAIKMYGDRFDYSKVVNVTHHDSEVVIICNRCLTESTVTVIVHLKEKVHICQTCDNVYYNNKTYNIETFIVKSKDKHPDIFNYDLLLPDGEFFTDSIIKLRCIKYNHITTPNVGAHLNSHFGCTECSGVVSWNYNKFIEKSTELYNDRFNYSKISPDAEIHCDSSVLLLCNVCNIESYIKLQNHIYCRGNNAGCPECGRCKKWTYDRFILRAIKIHGAIYKYNNTPESIQNCYSILDVVCNLCNYNWTCKINDHINDSTGCPKCAKKLRWTYDRFIEIAYTIHGNSINYTSVKPNDIVNSTSRPLLICNKCNFEWSTTLSHHINSKSGCPKCKSSHGEIECYKQLNLMNIKTHSQFSLKSLPRKKYDFYFTYNNINYLLEWDGRQHIYFSPYFHKNIDDFVKQQQRDILKTKIAIQEGYHIIRIDYKCINDIKFHIENALNSTESAYFSTKELYAYIIDEL